MPRVVMKIAMSKICGFGSSGTGFIVGARRMVPWLPAPAGAPTIKPKRSESVKIEFKLGFPESGGEN